MTSRFLLAVGFVLAHETVYQKGHSGDDAFVVTEHDDNDPGGATRYGIDQRDHPEVDVNSLTLARATQLYLTGEYGPTHAEQLAAGWGEAVFDSAVNCGVGRSLVWMQEALATGNFYHGAIDASVGPMTIAATQQADKTALRAFLDRRRSYYRALGTQPRFKDDLKGWLNRVDDLQKFIKA